jgi:hypothetical protein
VELGEALLAMVFCRVQLSGLLAVAIGLSGNAKGAGRETRAFYQSRPAPGFLY